jgi:putative membrane protein
LLGFVISLLLVFRTNTAYERWWEGRKLWGALLNCSRNMSMRLHVLLRDEPEHMKSLKTLLINYPYALKNHLRNLVSDNNDELDTTYHISGLAKHKHIPVYISDSIYSRLQELNKKGVINTENFISLGTDWQQLMEICGACERIKNTPIPFSYSTFIKKFLIIYIFTLPIAYGPSLGYYAVPIVAFIFYVLTSLELIAEEIENPFGTDDNDLPLDEIAKNIRVSVETIMHSTPEN